MGAWGHGSFDNDDAMDWLQEFDAAGAAAATTALSHVTSLNEGGYLEAPEASMALAAAELIAAARSGDSSRLPADAAPMLARHQPSLTGAMLLDTARRAVARVLKESELKELWEDSPDRQAWQDGVQDLLSRLR
jgi:hypothetical protein